MEISNSDVNKIFVKLESIEGKIDTLAEGLAIANNKLADHDDRFDRIESKLDFHDLSIRDHDVRLFRLEVV